ncbi:MAG: DUF2442 domain-containing protein [Caldilineaceae bacterium]
MANLKLGKWKIDEQELDRQFDLATARGQEWLEIEPQVEQASYDAVGEKLVLELKNGVVFQLPKRLVQGLATASNEAISTVTVGPRGASLHWESLDLDFSVTGLLAGIFGTRVWMSELGRRGGKATSSAKTASSRINGKKGGRPRQFTTPPTP